MKITTLLIVFGIINVMASNSYSQKATISINMNDASLELVLDEIENQSEFYFLFNQKLIDVKRKVRINAKSQKIEKVLDKLFAGTNVNYVVFDRQIVLTTTATNDVLREINPAFSKRIYMPGQANIQNWISLNQEKSVTGKVTSSEDESGLPGVNVIIKGTAQGTVTDVEGNYKLEVSDENSVLVFSYVGYHLEEVIVGSQTVINISLSPDVTALDEIVVIGYGTVKKSDLTGSVSQIKTELLEAVPVFNMEQALKIGAAGVRVSQNSGAPGGRIEVRIRGANSMIGGNQPLYVVDGFPVTGGIDFLNPSDIESVDILKDASATAIYGSRGANGVVIITSKRGKQGQKSKIEFNSFFGMQEAVNRYDLLDAREYAIIANEWLKNEGLTPYFQPDQVENPGTDWWDAIFSPAPIQTHTLTFSGSSEKTRYSFSGNYYDQVGIIENSGVKRGSIRLNLDHDLKSWLKMGVNLQAGRRDRNKVPVDNGFRGSNSIMSGAASAPPTLPLYDENGLPTQIEQAYNFGSADMRNPLIYTVRKDNSLVNSILGNVTFDIEFTPHLSFRTLLGTEYEHVIGQAFTPIIYPSDRGSASERNSYTNSFLNENILTYSNTFNDNHSLNVIGGFTYQTNEFRNSSIGVSGFANNTTENYDLSAAETIGNPSSGYADWTLVSFLARANYTFDSKYMITGSIRADGSSRFGADQKWGYFPSGAVAWRISEESFMSGISFINSLKLRGSYGVTGNTALAPYQSLDRLNSIKYIYDHHTDVIGFVPTGIANTDLKWESTAQLDIGFDFNILDNRLRFVVDYYKKNTKDLLASIPLPPSVGFGSTLKNIGEIQNTGFEFSVDADIFVKEFKWDVSAQLSFNNNEVIEIAGDSDIFGAGQGAAWPSANIARVGEEFGAFYGLLEDGLDENGFIKYQDLSGPDGEPDGIVNALDRVILGSYYPDFIYGFMSNFSYKNFEFNIAIEGVQGNELFNATHGTHLNSFQRGNNQFKDIIGNYWTEENPDPNAKYPKISAATQITVSERFIEDASYLRIRSLRLAYNIPVSKIFDFIQVYISGTNLFTFTKYTGIDPEASTRGTDSGNVANRLRIGHDQSSYPNAKIYAIGLKLSF